MRNQVNLVSLDENDCEIHHDWTNKDKVFS